MKTQKSRKISPGMAFPLLAATFLASGCVEHRVTYVPAQTPPVYLAQAGAPVPVETPQPPASEPIPQPAPPPAPAVLVRSSAELDHMLAPIALYPDPLLAQILPAATLPEQVVLADRFLREGGDPNLIDVQPWDLSLKALARYPEVLAMLDENLAWTTDLGQAFLNQPTEVMDSVQRLRAQAQAVGNLLSTPQQTVVMDDRTIEIVPANPEVIFVPVYQPEIVFVQPPPAPGRLRISFGLGLPVGAWLNHDCDWRDHEVIVWHHDHPRPADWWYQPASHRPRPVVINHVTEVNRNTTVNQNVSVWRPRTQPVIARDDRSDRGWDRGPAPSTPAPRAVRPTPAPQPSIPARPTEARPAPAPKGPTPISPPREVRPAPAPQPGVPTRPTEARPAPAPKGPTPISPPREVRPTPAPKVVPPALETKTVRPAPAPIAAKPPTTERKPAAPSVSGPPLAPPKPANLRPATGALMGIQNARETRESSSRGQQSRQATVTPTKTTSPPAATESPHPKTAEPRKPAAPKR